MSGTIAPDRIHPHARDGIVTAGTGPSTSRAPRHIARPLRACSPSTSDRSDTPRAATGRGQVYRCEAIPLRPIAMEKEALHLAPQLRHGSTERLQPRIDDDGPLRTQPIE